MTNEALLVTASYDLAADYVASELRRKGRRYFRLDTDKFPGEILAAFDPARGVVLDNGNQTLSGDNVAAVWYRRHVAPDLPVSQDEGTRDFCERESRAFLSGVLYSLVTPNWLSSAIAISAAERKPYQLKIARDLGFTIPETLITNDPAAALSMAQRHRVVAKAVSSGYIGSPEGNRAIFTSLLGQEDLDDLTNLSLSPVIFQQFVDKRMDIRVTVVGSNLFAAEIHSQVDSASSVDWRATSDPNLHHAKHRLPEAIEETCLSLVATLGLGFGAIDLALLPDGGYVFFEINPNGEWVWIEDQLGYPISASIAEWLDASMG